LKQLEHLDGTLGKIAGLTIVNAKVVSMLGARTMVGKFLNATLPQLIVLQCTKVVARSFRQSIEEVMLLMDDVPLPAEYYSALIALTSTILAALDR
jgi:hypothetical protein